MKEIETPKLYLSTSEGKWRCIYQGMPCCKDFDTVDNPFKVYHMTREQLHWDHTNDIPLWNGDLGKFQIMDNFTKTIR
jgi:hypothetical protein